MCHHLHVWTSWYRLVVCDESLIILLQTSKDLAQIQGSGCLSHIVVSHTRVHAYTSTHTMHACTHSHTHTHERTNFKDTMLVKTKQFSRCVIMILIFKTISCRLLTLQTMAGKTSMASSTSQAVHDTRQQKQTKHDTTDSFEQWKTFPQVSVTE